MERRDKVAFCKAIVKESVDKVAPSILKLERQRQTPGLIVKVRL